MNVARRFEVVSNELPEPPYPGDIRAKGMGLMVDIERMKQSTSWVLCPADMRPWMVMLWIESWTSSPCGSYEDDDEVIAARIGMNVDLFAVHRKHLMRGWSKASDGRLYHPHITTLVLEMCAVRQKDRARMAAYRARKDEPVAGEFAGVTRDTHATSPEFAAGSGSGTGTGSGKKTRAPRQSRSASPTVSVDDLVNEHGVDRQHATDWLTLRKAKRLPLTPSAWGQVVIEAGKAGMTPAQAVQTSVANSWAGFKASWLAPSLDRGTVGKQAAIEAANRSVAERWASKGDDK